MRLCGDDLVEHPANRRATGMANSGIATVSLSSAANVSAPIWLCPAQWGTINYSGRPRRTTGGHNDASRAAMAEATLSRASILVELSFALKGVLPARWFSKPGPHCSPHEGRGIRARSRIRVRRSRARRVEREADSEGHD